MTFLFQSEAPLDALRVLLLPPLTAGTAGATGTAGTAGGAGATGTAGVAGATGAALAPPRLRRVLRLRLLFLAISIYILYFYTPKAETKYLP